MKIKKLFVIASLFMAALVVFAGGVTASASKKKITYISTIPRSMHGTWYSYDLYDHHMGIAKITAHSIYLKYGKSSHAHWTVHKYAKHNVEKYSKKKLKRTKNWIYMYKYSNKMHGHKWIGWHLWDADAGAGEYYAIGSHKGHKALVEAGGADVITDSTYYKTKKLAKKYKHVKLPKFKYNDVD